jgi:hypothetical protein
MVYAPKWAGGVPEMLFGAAFGYAAYLATGLWWLGMAGAIWSWLWMETGHGNIYRMTGIDGKFPDAPERIERWGGRWLFERLGGRITTPAYSWWCMGIKGLMIGLPAAPAGLLLAILWPASYWIGHRVERQPEVAEWLSGLMAGAVIALSVL